MGGVVVATRFDKLLSQIVCVTVWLHGYGWHLSLSFLLLGETGIGKSTLMDSLFKESFPGQSVPYFVTQLE